MSQSKNTTHVFGAIDVLNYTDLNNTRMTGLASPILDNDAANKEYVDNKVVASNLTGGVGITVDTSNNTINSNPNATHIVGLGNIQTGTWTANTIQIPYGGTGQSVFTVNKLIYYNSANKLSSIPEFSYDSNTFNSTLPFVMSNTTDTVNSLSSLGSLIVNGGVNIGKSLYVNGSAIFNADITVGNITINGGITLNAVSANNAVYQSITTNNLLTTYLTSDSTNSLNLQSTNNTFTNILVTSNTVINSRVTGTLNVPSLGIFGSINSSMISSGSIIGLASYITNSSSANITTTNLRSTNATISNISSTSNTMQNLVIPTLLNSVNSNLTTLTNTNGTLRNITNTNLISSNSTVANIINTNITSTAAYINTISAGNIQASGTITITNATASNINTTNISSTNTVFTSTSINNLIVAGTSNMTTLNLTTITTSNIYLNNLFTSIFNNQNSTTIGTLNVNGLSIFSTTNSNNTSTGTLYSNISVNTTSSIGTLNVSNIYTNNLYASTLVNSPDVLTTNITTSHLRSSGISIQGTVLSTNLSTGTINVSSIINTQNFNASNSTISNILTTNATTTNLRITLSSAGNSYIVNSTTSNAFILNSNVTNETISTALITKNAIIVANYQGTPLTTAGSFFTIYPSTFINNATASGGSINNWYANYIGASTLSAINTGITTSRVANFYVKSNVVVGGNQTITYNSAMTIGYVTNTTGGNMNNQLSFERSDGNPLGAIYTESATNRLVFMNGSLSGGGGIGIYTIKDTPVIYSNIPSSTNITPTSYIQLLNTTSTFYSTIDSDSITTGSLVLQGGLAVAKNITANTIKTSLLIADNISSDGIILSGNSTIGNLHIDGNVTITNGTFVSTNITTITLNASTGITSASAQITNLNATTITAGTSRITTSLLALGNSNTIGNIFTTAGNVGIGTAFPAAPLHVFGTTNALSTTVGGIFMGTFTDNQTFIQMNSSTGSYIDFSGINNDMEGRILYNNASDYFDFFTNSTVVARMDNVGGLTMIGDITAFGNISDRRLKDNIVNIPLDIALDKVKNLRPVTFTWRDTIQNKAKRGTTDAGFIAQEVEDVVEYAVGEFDDIVSGERYKKLNHERIIPYLVGAIQLLQQKIDQSSCGLFTLSNTSYPIGESNIEFNTTSVFNDSVNISVYPFTIGSSIIRENVVTFLYSGVYSIHLRLNSSTTTTSPTLLQTNLNKYVGNQWEVYQTSSQKTIFDAYTDFHSHFMIKVQANEHWKFTLNNGHSSNFVFSGDSKKTRLMINKVG